MGQGDVLKYLVGKGWLTSKQIDDAVPGRVPRSLRILRLHNEVLSKPLWKAHTLYYVYKSRE